MSPPLESITSPRREFDCHVIPYLSFTFIFIISPHSPPRVDIHPLLLEFDCYVIPYTILVIHLRIDDNLFVYPQCNPS